MNRRRSRIEKVWAGQGLRSETERQRVGCCGSREELKWVGDSEEILGGLGSGEMGWFAISPEGNMGQKCSGR
ncbi:hypothetical protein RchiOBHm_Chr3g0475701 [Rosa chinensis]|uniref:Uncharacterized protein n=1 Tax=Rosa chinensis TaxID=74649 RepID=A0A2P6RCF7_ROSCH|nr:hypothetical protein RchiOBHm_Chr3g0475701 [Rosa chinensis]